MKYKLQDLIDIDHFQNLQDRLNKIYAFPSAIIDNDGNILTATAWQEVCSQFHRKNKEAQKLCIKSDQYISSHLHEADPAVSYRCPHGLTDNATPIIIDGIHYGNFFTGQFFLEAPDPDFFRAQAKKYGFDENAYIAAIKKVPIWTQEQLENYLFFIKGLIAVISESGLKRLKEIENRKQIEESAKRHRSILKTAIDGFIMTDSKSKIIGVNEAYCRLSGYSENELLTMRIGDLEADEDLQQIDSHMQKIKLQGFDRFESKHKRKDGTIFEVEISIQFRSDEGGQFISFVRDITDRKKSERDQRKLEMQLANAMETAHLGHWEYHVEKDQLAFNDQFYKIFGTTAELSGGYFMSSAEYVQKFVHPEDRVAVSAEIRKSIETSDPYLSDHLEHRILYHDGKVGHVAVRYFIDKDGQGKTVRVYGILQDITERKLAENVLKESQSNMTALIENTDDILVLRDIEGKAIVYNQAFAKIVKALFGVEAYMGICTLDYLPEDKKNYWNNILSKVHSGASHHEEFSYEVEGTLRYFETSFNPITVDAKIVGSAELTRDITEQIEMESRIQQAQKMEAIGNLAGGIAHDFNNILSPIVGMSELLIEDLPDDSPEYESVKEILKAGQRGADLVKQILAFSRQSEHQLIPVRVQQILKEVLKLMRATIPSFIEIQEDIQPDCGLIVADPTQIHQVAMNIITNAFHAVESKGGKITIRLREIEGTEADLIEATPVQRQYVLLSIRDTGAGIPSNLMDNIFEPYFTTKEKGKGTGLGLAVVYGIIKEHKGEIKVYSEVGKGTTFDIFLPLMATGEEVKPFEKAKDNPRGNERILLVDDEEAIAKLEKLMLERLGYQVAMRFNSLEAFEAFKARPASFDLIISDMTMPNMTGDQLAGKLMAIRPTIPIIICTGFSERLNQEKAATIGVKGFLMKPIVLSDLAKMVRKVLDDAKGANPASEGA